MRQVHLPAIKESLAGGSKTQMQRQSVGNESAPAEDRDAFFNKTA
jgi:hypothetical protein